MTLRRTVHKLWLRGAINNPRHHSVEGYIILLSVTLLIVALLIVTLLIVTLLIVTILIVTWLTSLCWVLFSVTLQSDSLLIVTLLSVALMIVFCWLSHADCHSVCWVSLCRVALCWMSQCLVSLLIESGHPKYCYIFSKRGLPSFMLYEKHVLLVLNWIYYWVYKCTTCHHYTNIIKNSLINLIKIRSLFTTEKGLA